MVPISAAVFPALNTVLMQPERSNGTRREKRRITEREPADR